MLKQSFKREPFYYLIMPKMDYKAIALTLGLIAFSFLFVWYVYAAWEEPTTAPPGGNVSAPLNIGIDSQTKTGDLTITPGSFYAPTFIDADDNAYYVNPSNTLVSAVLSGNVGIGTTSPDYSLHIVNPIDTTYKMFFDSVKGAFRAGRAQGSQWDDVNIGPYSTAMGINTTASGDRSTAIGYLTTANNYGSTAIGYVTTASGNYSTAIGYNSTASGFYSLAMGNGAIASGNTSVAMGHDTTSSGGFSTTLGRDTTASGAYSDAFGRWLEAGPAGNTMVFGKGVNDSNPLVNNIQNSLMVGFNSDIPTLFVGPSAGVGTTGNVGIGTNNPTSKLQVVGLLEYTDNAAAIAGGLTVGAFYRTGDVLKVVH